MERLCKMDMMKEGFSYEDLLAMVEEAVEEMKPKDLKCLEEKCPASCCLVPPTITEMEFDHLKPFITSVTGYESGACPLLADGLCSVYEARPVECRLYNRIDKVVGVGCGNKMTLPDSYLVVRGLIYQFLWFMNGGTTEKHISQWAKEKL